jgi:hypothetical protein
MPEKTVRVLDTKTHTITTIPASELAPGMVRARVAGIEGDVWIDASTLHPNEGYAHPPFTGELRQKIETIQELMAEVLPKSYEEWEDGFRRDQHPESEIAIWCNLALGYRFLTDGQDYPDEAKREVLRILLACINNGREHVLATVTPQFFSREQVREMLDRLDAEWRK